MSQLVTIFCDIDDFCKHFEPLDEQRAITSTVKPRRRPTALSLSELMTVIVYFHTSHDRHFNAYDRFHVQAHLRPSFPHLVSDSRLVELMPRALVPLTAYLRTRRAKTAGMALIDSTSIAVCHPRRTRSHKVVDGLAQLGQTSMGWFDGFNLHLILHDQGELIACRLTPGHVDDRQPVRQLSQGLVGTLFGDRGDISNSLHEDLLEQGLDLITRIRKHMNNRLVSLFDKLMRRQRTLIESVNDQLKHISQIEPTRHRRVRHLMVNMVAGLIASTYDPTKPS